MTFPRVRVDEWMDQPDLTPQRHQLALTGLRRLNRFSGISGILFKQIRRLARQCPHRPLRVLDIASGSGDLPIDWLLRAERRGIPLKVTALDRSEFALEMACQNAAQSGVTLGTMQRDCLRDGLPSGFDVVTSSLFMHHLDPPEVSKLIHEMWRVSSQAMVICDLERSRANLALVAASSRLLSRSDIVHHDAAASVRAAYTRNEFTVLLHHALGFPVPVRGAPPCRFLAVIPQIAQTEEVAELTPAIVGAAS